MAYCRWIFEICKHPKVLEAAQKILGPNVVLFSTCLITKYPVEKQNENFVGHYVGWHQDQEYCGLENVGPNDENPKLITMWLAIDEVTNTIKIYHSEKLNCIVQLALFSF